MPIAVDQPDEIALRIERIHALMLRQYAKKGRNMAARPIVKKMALQ